MTLTGTNSWVLQASGQCVVVDPGPLDEKHLATLASFDPCAIMLTHGHQDHVEGVERLIALTGASVVTAWESPECEIESIPTPGHTSDSVSLLVNGEAVLTGDTILGQGSTIVAYPDGNLADYLASLALLGQLGSIPVLPGHGPPLADVSIAAAHYLAHRRTRLRQVAAALTAGATTAREVVEAVYSDTDPKLWWAAELTVQAQLDYLAAFPVFVEEQP
jgi:glyoxylase-like metal-dependent hydrolase (beta-lactamase superfamily II)